MAIYVCPPQAVRIGPASTSRLWGSTRRAIEDLAKRAQKPAAVRRLTQLAPGERTLVATCDLSDAAVIATNAALHQLGPPDGAGDWSRWGWEQVSRIEWHASTSTMTLIGQAPLLPDRVVLTLAEAGPLVEVARERVAWTTLLATRVPLPGGGTARVVVRRHPVTDRRDWFLYPDATVASHSARVDAELAHLVAAMRADTGL